MVESALPLEIRNTKWSPERCERNPAGVGFPVVDNDSTSGFTKTEFVCMLPIAEEEVADKAKKELCKNIEAGINKKKEAKKFASLEPEDIVEIDKAIKLEYEKLSEIRGDQQRPNVGKQITKAMAGLLEQQKKHEGIKKVMYKSYAAFDKAKEKYEAGKEVQYEELANQVKHNNMVKE